MTRAEIVEEIATTHQMKKSDVDNVICDFMGYIKFSLENDTPVELRGFGTFKLQQRKSKKARDISRNKEIIIPARMKPVWKPSGKLVRLVNGEPERV